jgi:hypothetical protein
LYDINKTIKEVNMTIQEAAHQILMEEGHYLPSKEIAKRAIEKGMVGSTAKDPILSLAQTIDKNIRDEIYNTPRLCFARDKSGRRVVGLPGWEENDKIVTLPIPPLTVEINGETVEMIELAKEAGLGINETEITNHLIRAGFKALASEIGSGLSKRFNELKKRMEELEE